MERLGAGDETLLRAPIPFLVLGGGSGRTVTPRDCSDPRHLIVASLLGRREAWRWRSVWGADKSRAEWGIRSTPLPKASIIRNLRVVFEFWSVSGLRFGRRGG